MHPMHPYIAQKLAAERSRELRAEAAAARRASLARRARRDGELVPLGRAGVRWPGAPRWA
jgi:hypothetical protein